MRINIIIGAVLLWICGVAAIQADEARPNPLDSTAILDLGGFFLSTDINVRLDGGAGGGDCGRYRV